MSALTSAIGGKRAFQFGAATSANDGRLNRSTQHLILNRRDRDYVLMSEKCRQGLIAAEKPEFWHRWQPGFLKAIRRAFGKR